MDTSISAPVAMHSLAPDGRLAAQVARDAPPRWQEATARAPFRMLLSLKTRYVAPLLLISFAFLIAMTLLAGFAKDFMGQKVAGSFNVGYLMVLLTYILCWGVSLIYVRAANQRFDPQAQIAIADLDAGPAS